MGILNWAKYSNFFFRGEPIRWVRRWQCDTFGHEWYCWCPKREPDPKNHISPAGWPAFCAWCTRPTEDHPKMRKRLEDKIIHSEVFDNIKKLNNIASLKWRYRERTPEELAEIEEQDKKFPHGRCMTCDKPSIEESDGDYCFEHHVSAPEGM